MLHDCDCEFTPDPLEPDEPALYYARTCTHCGAAWFSLHCPHDGVQRPCPNGHINDPHLAHLFDNIETQK